MTTPAEPEAAGRLQRAVDAFQKGQGMLLAAHCKLQGLPPEEVGRFWLSAGAQLEAHMSTTATEVLTAFKAFSAAGLVDGSSARFGSSSFVSTGCHPVPLLSPQGGVSQGSVSARLQLPQAAHFRAGGRTRP